MNKVDIFIKDLEFVQKEVENNNLTIAQTIDIITDLVHKHGTQTEYDVVMFSLKSKWIWEDAKTLMDNLLNKARNYNKIDI